MQELGEAHAGADPDLGTSVLLNSLIFAHIWGLLDVDDKRQLRAVDRGVRALADGLVVLVTMNSKPATELGAALARWPDLQRLTADGDVHSAAVISAAQLSKLRALVLEVGEGQWSAPVLSHTAAAGLEELDFSSERRMHIRIWLSIEAVRDCTELRKLSVFGCIVLDLAALGGCVHLEEVYRSCVCHRQRHPRPCIIGRLCQTEETCSCWQPAVRPCTLAGLRRAPGPRHRRVWSPGEPGGTTDVKQAGAFRLVLPGIEQP